MITKADREAARLLMQWCTLIGVTEDMLLDHFAAHRLLGQHEGLEKAADALAGYCRDMNGRGKEASFLDAHRAICEIKEG